ncbi:ATP-binding cassette domain-containing protein, partial [Paenibacillus sepulcri]|nr:ATP-binding cassette domain-containing protein [Paenibacillus sepulcri]
WPNELSGGELQRICIARALGSKTRFVIADEMTTMLDAVTQAQIWHAVLAIARERKLGLLLISHDLHLIERLCHRWIRLGEA